MSRKYKVWTLEPNPNLKRELNVEWYIDLKKDIFDWSLITECGWLNSSSNTRSMHIWVVFESESWFTKPDLDKEKKDLFKIEIKISRSRSEFCIGSKTGSIPISFRTRFVSFFGYPFTFLGSMYSKFKVLNPAHWQPYPTGLDGITLSSLCPETMSGDCNQLKRPDHP